MKKKLEAKPKSTSEQLPQSVGGKKPGNGLRARGERQKPRPLRKPGGKKTSPRGTFTFARDTTEPTTEKWAEPSPEPKPKPKPSSVVQAEITMAQYEQSLVAVVRILGLDRVIELLGVSKVHKALKKITGIEVFANRLTHGGEVAGTAAPALSPEAKAAEEKRLRKNELQRLRDNPQPGDEWCHPDSRAFCLWFGGGYSSWTLYLADFTMVGRCGDFDRARERLANYPLRQEGHPSEHPWELIQGEVNNRRRDNNPDFPRNEDSIKNIRDLPRGADKSYGRFV